MDPQFLLKDEVEYELACRGINLKSTVSVMKKVLNEVMQSQHGQITNPPQLNTVKYELEVCAAKLNVLSNYISELSGRPDRNQFKRLVSRLYHVQNRISFIQPEVEDDGIRKEGVLQQCQVLLDKLEGQDDLVEDQNLTAEDKAILENTLGELGRQIIQKFDIMAVTSKEPIRGDSFSEEQRAQEVVGFEKNVSFAVNQWGQDSRWGQSSRSKFIRSSTVDEEEMPKRKLVPVYQWGLKFSGGSSTSVNAFLERVSELKEARNATNSDLWRYAIDFFEGDALIWYRANREYATNWEELVILLRRAFQRPYYQEELLAEIRARTQGHDESVLIYISVMQNMFNRLPNRISETEKLSVILKNLQPYYQQAVCRDNFSAVPELINVLRIIERTKLNCDRFQEPAMSRDRLEPDLAYRVGTQGTGLGEVAEIKSAPVRELGAAKPAEKRCWNCRESGHLFRECTVPRQRLFCYKCGRFGKTAKDCECKGNAQGGN